MDVLYWLLTARIIHEFENLLKFPVWSMAVSILVKNNNNYWTRLSKIYIVICQWWADQYLPKLNAKSNNIDLRVCKVSQRISLGSKAICHFHARAIARRRKAWFHLRMSRILFAAKRRWTTLCILSRPLFVGGYLQVTWWGLGQWKGRRIEMFTLMLLSYVPFYVLRILC